MTEIINPYIAGAPVTEARMFFGREDVFQWIENSVAGKYADHILVIHGQRRVGKTSVLKQLGNRLPHRYIPVFFDLQGRTHTTLDRFLWWLAREIVRVSQRSSGAPNFPCRKKRPFSGSGVPGRAIPAGAPTCACGWTRSYLTFDEFDNLEENEVKEELARPLIDYLRRLMGSASLNFIFSIGSSGRKLENMQAAYTEFFKTALYKKISFLDKEQAHDLVTLPVEGVLEYDQAAVDRIFEIAGGHPYFTQLTCHELFARCQRTEQRRVSQPDVEAVLDDVVERGTVNLKFVWDEASDIEKWALAGLAHLGKSDHRALADFLRKQRVRFSESDLTSGLLHLREKDILTPENHFVIHLLDIWLKKNRPIDQVREELTEVNPIANRYIEIGLQFKDGGASEKAIESFREALAIAPGNVQAQVNIGLTYMDQKLFAQAVTEFEKALALDDEDVSARSGLCDAQLALGDAAMSKGRAREAIQSYQRVLSINAEHLEARQRMAEISRLHAEKALADGHDEEALSAFAESLRYRPEDPGLVARVEQIQAERKARVLASQFQRAEKECAARNWDKAIAILEEALEISPEADDVRRKITEVKDRRRAAQLRDLLASADQAERSGRWDAAIAALNEYVSLNPEDTAIQQRLSALMLARRSAWLEAVSMRADRAVTAAKWNEASAALNEVLSLEPDNPEIKAKLAQVREAEHTARLESLLERAQAALRSARWDAAIEVLNDGLSLEPQNAGFLEMLAAARESKRVARLQAAFRLVETASQAGNWTVALEALNEILAADPQNAEVQRKTLRNPSEATGLPTRHPSHAGADAGQGRQVQRGPGRLAGLFGPESRGPG